MENLVGDFGGVSEILGDNGAVGGVSVRSICVV